MWQVATIVGVDLATVSEQLQPWKRLFLLDENQIKVEQVFVEISFLFIAMFVAGWVDNIIVC